MASQADLVAAPRRGAVAWLAAVDRGLGRVEWLVAAAALVVMVISTALGVLFRGLLNSPLAWANDLAVLAMLWLAFIGASALYKERGHIAVDALGHLLPPRGRAWLGSALIVMMGTAIAVTGIEMLPLVRLQHLKVIPSLGLPRSANGIPVLWMSASMVLSSIVQLLIPAPDAAREG